jgi:ubiquitin C-terminal hydrolase
MLGGIADLNAALQNRKKYVDENSEVAEGSGAALGEVRVSGSKFAGVSFVDKSTTGFTGLVNQGATCYLNSLLQGLYMVPEFRRAVYAWEYVQALHGDEDVCVPLQVRTHIQHTNTYVHNRCTHASTYVYICIYACIHTYIRNYLHVHAYADEELNAHCSCRRYSAFLRSYSSHSVVLSRHQP